MVCTTGTRSGHHSSENIKNFCSRHSWETMMRNQRAHASTSLLAWPITMEGKTLRIDQVGLSNAFATNSALGLPYFCLRFCRQMHSMCVSCYSLCFRLIFRYLGQYAHVRSVHWTYWGDSWIPI